MRIFTDEDLRSEYWKPLVDFEDYCEVSNLGRVRTFDKITVDKRGNPKKLKVEF